VFASTLKLAICMMLSSLYSSLPAVAAVTTAPTVVKASLSDEKRIVPYQFQATPSRGFFMPRALALKQKKGKKKHTQNVISLAVVPEIVTSIKFTHIYRFVAQAGISTSVTIANCFGALGGIVTLVAGTTFQPWCSSFRLRKITIYESAQNVATVASEIVWAVATNATVPDIVTNNTTVPYDRPTINTKVPPKNSLADFWFNITTATLANDLFGLNCAIGSIVDVTFDAVLANNMPTASGVQTVTSTAGLVIYRPLVANLTPVGLPFA